MTKYDWPLYGFLAEMRMRRAPQLRRKLNSVRNRLRTPHHRERLVYRGYEMRFPEVRFQYEVAGREYTNRLWFDTSSERELQSCASAAVQNILSNIGMGFIPFMFCVGNFRTIQVDVLPLDDEARRFFADTYLKCLAEWRLDEGFRLSHPIEIVSTRTDPPQRPQALFPDDQALLLNGGGKDSAVAAELLTRLGMSFRWLTFDPNPTQRAVTRISGRPSVDVRVELDPALRTMSLYRRPAPVLVLYSFVSLLVACLGKCKYIFVGNEYSANFGNVTVEGLDVNHQFCKSHEYEATLDRYVKSHVLTDIAYLSILRPLYDLRVGRLFANFPQYFDAFVSCNVGIESGTWCKACPKCAFVCLCLSPFLRDEELTRIFGDDLLERNAIRRWIVWLIVGKIKPFECVGTREECRLALAMTLAKDPDREFRGWPRRRDLERCCKGVDIAADRRKFVDSFMESSLLTPMLRDRLRGVLESLS